MDPDVVIGYDEAIVGKLDDISQDGNGTNQCLAVGSEELQRVSFT